MINRNKNRRDRFSNEDNREIYLKKDQELDLLKCDNSRFAIFNNKRILIDVDSVVSYVKIRCRGGYIECSVTKIINGVSTSTSLGRHLLCISDNNLRVDHINRNPLDNRKCNLKVCSQSQNLSNRAKFSKINKWKGYTKAVWSISVESQFNNVRRKIKLSSLNERYAAIVYDCLAITHQGDFACLNFNRDIYSDEYISWIMKHLTGNIKNSNHP